MQESQLIKHQMNYSNAHAPAAHNQHTPWYICATPSVKPYIPPPPSTQPPLIPPLPPQQMPYERQPTMQQNPIYQWTPPHPEFHGHISTNGFCGLEWHMVGKDMAVVTEHQWKTWWNSQNQNAMQLWPYPIQLIQQLVLLLLLWTWYCLWRT